MKGHINAEAATSEEILGGCSGVFSVENRTPERLKAKRLAK
jgi:hypothetical protein